MTTLWLSVASLAAGAEKPSVLRRVAGLVAGFHLDVLATDPRALVLKHVQSLPTQLPFDLHFIDRREDSALITDAVAAGHPRLRHVYSPAAPTSTSAWNLAGTASAIAAGEWDDALPMQRRVLVTAPSAARPLDYRLDVVQRAVARISLLAGAHVAIVLDRDVNRELARVRGRDRIAEIVVGKAVFESLDLSAAISNINEAWGIKS